MSTNALGNKPIISYPSQKPEFSLTFEPKWPSNNIILETTFPLQMNSSLQKTQMPWRLDYFTK
jgi:hypothetical protein